MCFAKFSSLSLLLQLFIVSDIALASNQFVTDKTISSLWKQFKKSPSNHFDTRIDYPFQECFQKAAKKHELPLVLLLAIARGESDFNPTAVSTANARGLMQILWPITANHLGIYKQKELFDPCTNVDAGARYLNELLNMYDGDLHLSLAAYNYGPARISNDGRKIPSKAIWYSKYIYQHLDFIINLPQDRALTSAGKYANIQKITLIGFNNPYLADLFMARTQEKVPSIRLEIFKTRFGQYRVMLISANRAELERNRQALRKAGFRMEDENVSL